MRIQPLLFKAEALYFIEVEASLKRDDVVGCYPCHGPVSGVASCVERQSSLPWNNLDLLLLWLEMPQQS